MQFWLTGTINYAVGSCRDSREVSIDDEFSAKNKEQGIEKARSLVEKLHKSYSHMTDYGMQAKLVIVRPLSTKTIWRVKFVDDQPARPARRRQVIKAGKAIPAIPAHLSEQRV